jgi:nuclear transport factor 2 (NTF2) superfamily protein
MRRRIASINDESIDAGDRKFQWPLGPRPGDSPTLRELGF